MYKGNSTNADVTFRLSFETLIWHRQRLNKELSSFPLMNMFVPTDILIGLYNFSISLISVKEIEPKKHCCGHYIKINHIIKCISIKSKFLWSIRVSYMNCSKYLQLSGCVNQKALFHSNWHSQFYQATWISASRTLQPMLRTLHCVNHC